MKIDIFSREYPPHVYGGAGVHVMQLVKELRKLEEVNVHAYAEGDPARVTDEQPNGKLYTYNPNAELKGKNSVFSTLDTDIQMASDVKDSDVVHSHTWYANLAGFLAKKYTGCKHVISAHSLEPLRPWKAEQLGGGYEISKWIEKMCYEDADGIIAVSHAMKKDILTCYKNVDPEKVTVIHNGVDLTEFPHLEDPVSSLKNDKVLQKYNIDPTLPTAVFVGRITRQKGLVYLLRALAEVKTDIQIILCASSPDTKEIEQEFNEQYENLKKKNDKVIWINEMLPHDSLVNVLANSNVFLCPSIYEPLGIVNLEAMAMKLPVVATATGGIVEVVVDNETGYLVEIEQLHDGTGTPIDPAKFVSDIAEKIDLMFSDLDKAKKMGEAGYQRAKDKFSWRVIAQQTVDFYKKVCE